LIGLTQFIAHGNSSTSDIPSEIAGGSLTITNLNVGKADCAVLQAGDIVGMIDTGTYDAYSTIDSFLKDNSITEIDFLILTHYDQDHIGSAVKTLSSVDVKNIYLADYVSQKEYYAGLMDSIKAKGWVITYIGANQDALEEAHKMHIDNGLSYDATPEGVKSMMKFERVKRAVLYDEIAKCASPAELRDVDYFGGGHKKKGKKS